jgi:hypothetical protein
MPFCLSRSLTVRRNGFHVPFLRGCPDADCRSVEGPTKSWDQSDANKRGLGVQMRKILVATAVAMCFASSGAVAQERVGDAALGALSGALVLGPVGAVAGAAIGYTAGPSIARSWGIGRSQRSSQARASNRSLASSPGRAQNFAAAPQASAKASESTGSISSTGPSVKSPGAPASQGYE